jgi:hypothetical protein
MLNIIRAWQLCCVAILPLGHTGKKEAAGEGGAGRFLVEPARAITGSRDPDQ